MGGSFRSSKSSEKLTKRERKSEVSPNCIRDEAMEAASSILGNDGDVIGRTVGEMKYVSCLQTNVNIISQ
eukprot:scaffold57_cov207-Alexandrium_tamarense.AAC.17